MNLRFGEINVLCTDRARSLAFYRDVLGLELVGEEDGALRLRAGSIHLLLLPIAKGPASQGDYGEQAELSFDLRTNDLASTQAHLEASGVSIVEDSTPTHLVIRDPDGLAIEIVAITP